MKPKRRTRRVSRAVRKQTTRSVGYTYRPADNARLAKFYVSDDWYVLRYEALKRDDFRCLCCGADAKRGAELHVDHIKPLRVFWELRLVLANLQTFCLACNVGKGSRHDDDFLHRS